jgi:hypothetical protein
MGTVPYVIERIKGGERSYDTYSRVLKERIINNDRKGSL